MARRIPSRRARCQLEHAFHEHSAKLGPAPDPDQDQRRSPFSVEQCRAEFVPFQAQSVSGRRSSIRQSPAENSAFGRWERTSAGRAPRRRLPCTPWSLDIFLVDFIQQFGFLPVDCEARTKSSLEDMVRRYLRTKSSLNL
ncbi:hypothetical protein EJB05_05767, partial [Eragrostis curvula]